MSTANKSPNTQAGPQSPVAGEARARARSNIALVKYWGKRDEALILPHTGSLSLTLDSLVTTTSVKFSGSEGEDFFELDAAPARQKERERVSFVLDLVREKAKQAGIQGLGAAKVLSANNFPTAGGLASSASGFAALAAAAAWAAGLDLDEGELSILARRGSGSATRSVVGGFGEWLQGQAADGSDSKVRQILPPEAWDVGMAVAVVDAGRKSRSSRDAMKDSVDFSPFYPAWVESTEQDLVEARAAIERRDLEALGAIAERSFLRMHATAMASEPAAIFWKPPTLAVLEEVRELRAEGIGAWSTVDAGPHVAVLCRQADLETIKVRLGAVEGVKEVLLARPGPGIERL